MDDLNVESFGAWVLAASLLTGHPDVARPLTLQSVAADLVKTTNVETFVMLDAQGHIVASGSGSAINQVNAKDLGDAAALCKKSGANLHMIHTHPGSASLSYGDIFFLQNNPGVSKISAIAFDGTVYTVSNLQPGAATKYFDRFAELERDLQARYKHDKKELQKLPHQVLTELDKAGALRYSVTRWK